MKTYKDVYVKLDPMIKANPKITLPEFKKKHPSLKISYWSFNARKKRLGVPVKANIRTKKKLAVKPVVQKKMTTAQIRKVVKKILPRTPHTKEYVLLGKILLVDPETAYAHLGKKEQKKTCEANFYKFRKAFCQELNLPLSTLKTVRKNGKRKKPVSPATSVVANGKQPKLCTILYETGSEGFNDKAREVIKGVFDALRNEEIVNLDMAELVHPAKTIEVRLYK